MGAQNTEYSGNINGAVKFCFGGGGCWERGVLFVRLIDGDNIFMEKKKG